jgi:hypothetical protein
MVTVVGPPVVAEPVAVSVNVLVVALVEVKAAVTPLGRPEAAKLTLPVKPPVGFTVIVLVLLPPWATFKVLGAADSVNDPLLAPISVVAITTTSRLLGSVKLFTVFALFRLKEYP